MNFKMSDSEAVDDVSHMFKDQNSKETASADVGSVSDSEDNKIEHVDNGLSNVNSGKRFDEVKYSELCLQDNLNSNVPCEAESRSTISKEEHLIALKNIEQYLGTIRKLEEQCQLLEQSKGDLQSKLEIVRCY